MIYSLNERPVGTWTDGTTIYQKSFEVTEYTAGTDNLIVPSSELPIEMLIYGEAVGAKSFEDPSGMGYFPFTTDGGYTNNTKVSIWYDDAAGVMLTAGSAVDYDGFMVTIRYIRSDD